MAAAGLARGVHISGCLRGNRCSLAFFTVPAGLQEREDVRGAMPSAISIPTTSMAKGLGSSGRGATMERSKLSLKQTLSQSSPKLDDGMGGGGLGGSLQRRRR